MATTAAVLAAALAVSGCATKNFVRDQVAVVDTRVTGVQGTAREALDRANAAQKLAEGKFVYQAVLSDDSIKFAANKDELSPEAQARLGELVQRLKSENRNVYIEIQGHADAAERGTGLGQARAESVRRYLNQQGIPLNRMATISYGKEQPVSPERTPDARAQNRRVVLIVMA